jgi:hypothetical protein
LPVVIEVKVGAGLSATNIPPLYPILARVAAPAPVDPGDDFIAEAAPTVENEGPVLSYNWASEPGDVAVDQEDQG